MLPVFLQPQSDDPNLKCCNSVCAYLAVRSSFKLIILFSEQTCLLEIDQNELALRTQGHGHIKKFLLYESFRICMDMTYTFLFSEKSLKREK